MDFLIELIEKIINYIKNLSTEQIALISIFVTFIIYVLGKQNELKLKKHELRKENYIKFIKTLQTFTAKFQTNNKEIKMTSKVAEEWFDMGSSLLLYGSKKLYKKYIFFRNFQSPLVKQCKYYEENLTLYLINDMLNQIRKEVGLNIFEGNTGYDSIAFFVNEMSYNPIAKQKWMKDRCKIFMIKFELFMLDRTKFIFLKKLYYSIVSPIIGILKVLFKYLVMLPIGKIIVKFCPNIAKKLQEK